MASSRTLSSLSPPDTVIVSPPTDISEALRTELYTLSKVRGWISAAVTRRDGLPIEHTFKSAREANILCAMSAAGAGGARSTGDRLRQGPITSSVVRYVYGLRPAVATGLEAIG